MEPNPRPGRKKKSVPSEAAEPLPLTWEANPVLLPEDAKTVDLGTLNSSMTLVRKRSRARQLVDMRRRENAKESLRELTRDNEVYGFTKGQFSLLDLITACLERTGPAHLSLSTWTAARNEIVAIEALAASGLITGTRWLIDYTFVRRDRSAAHQIRKTFGFDSIRVANTHSKFCIFQNEEWKLVLRSSMNLNMNPRFEDFTIANDPEVADFLGNILDEIWSKQKKELSSDGKPGDFERFFRDNL